MSQMKEKMKDFMDFCNKRVERQLMEIENSLNQVFLSMEGLKHEKIIELSPLKDQILQNLAKIRGDFNRKTQDGTILIDNLNRKTRRLYERIPVSDTQLEEYAIDRFQKEFLSYNDHLYAFAIEIENLSYKRAGFTVMGIILAFLPPPVGIFSLVMGASLILDKDVRAKLNGIVMVVIAVIVAVYHLVLF